MGGGGDRWRLKETEEDLTAKGNAWSLTGYWFEKKIIAIKEKWGNLSMDCIYMIVLYRC